MTTWGQGDDVPIWSHAGPNLSSSSESQTEEDSGIGSYRKPLNDARSTAQHDHTPWYSLDTVKRLHKGDLRDAPLSDHGGNSDRDQKMVSGDDGVIETMGVDPTGPTGQEATITNLDVNLVVALEAPLLADTDDEKAHRDAFQLFMQGFHTAIRTFSDEYQEACKEVQTIVRHPLPSTVPLYGGPWPPT